MKEFPTLFSELGRITGVNPIYNKIDNSVKPVQQKRQTIPLKYVDRFKGLLDELSARGVVSGPLDHRSSTRWIHNPVIVEKNFGEK